MRIDCFKCNAVYEIPDAAIGPGGVRAQCPRCGTQETIRPDRTDVKKVLGERPVSSEVTSSEREDLFDYSGSAPSAPPASEDLSAGMGKPTASGSGGPPPLPKRAEAPAPGLVEREAPVPAAPPPSPSPVDDDPFADLGKPVASGPAAPPLSPAPVDDDPFADLGQPTALPSTDPSPPNTADDDDPFADLARPPAARSAPAPAVSPPSYSGGAAPGIRYPDFDAPVATSTSESSSPPPPSSDDPFADSGTAPAGPVAVTGPPAASGVTTVYRVKKLDGRVIGPFNLEVIEEMAELGDVAPGDQIARGRDEFRLLSQYPETRVIFDKAASRFRVKSARDPYQAEKRSRWPIVLGGLIVVVLGSAAALAVFRPELLPEEVKALWDRSPALPDNPVLADLPLFRMQIQELEDDAQVHLDRAESLMAEDHPAAYSEADLEIKSALVIDPDDPVAIGRLVMNAAFIHDWQPNPSAIQTLISYARYLEEAVEESASSLQARAAVRVMVGGEGAEARRLAERAVQADPGDPFARLVLARATSLVDRQSAIESLRELASDDNSPRRVHVELADICTFAGDFACAKSALERRLELDPGHEKAAGQLAQVLMMVGRHQEARRVYADAVSSHPGRLEAALAMAMLDYQVGGNIGPARRRIDALLASRGESWGAEIDRRIRVHAATLARLQRARPRAKELLDEVFEDAPHHGPASYQAVLLALDEGDLDAASARLPSALVDMDHAAKRYYLRALVHAHKESFDDAAREARRAISAQPEAIEPILLAAALEGRRGQSQQAWVQLRRALSIDPLDVHRNRVPTDYWDGALLEAETLAGFEALVEREPGQAMAHAGLGISRWLVGSTGPARSSLNQAVRLDRRNLPALTYLGVIDLQAGNLGSAATWLERAVAADGNHPLPRYLLGRVAERRGAGRAAADAYRDSLRRDQAFHPAQVRQALLAASEDPQGSRETLSRIVISRPESLAAREALFEIGER